ncbi:hypothetical protein WA026_008066 [Henosepilachna vigintioctopunctata]|uniref:Uncharacterized protein n=1 Tax=Henosepilachna vigintioctopunctata TaxID=420089 RepID=A0AAW1TTM9_9CUCU
MSYEEEQTKVLALSTETENDNIESVSEGDIDHISVIEHNTESEQYITIEDQMIDPDLASESETELHNEAKGEYTDGADRRNRKVYLRKNGLNWNKLPPNLLFIYRENNKDFKVSRRSLIKMWELELIPDHISERKGNPRISRSIRQKI